MDELFRPLLSTTDWNEEWKALQTVRQHYDDPAVWDERSKTFATKHGSQSEYVTRFLELAGVREGETVFDMGCGTGALTCPLARDGFHVIAADFSEGMLGQLRSQLEKDGTTELVDIVKMSWADDWDAYGIGENAADVAFASRSIATDDMQDALLKLTHVARRRACVTLSLGSSPRTDLTLMRAAGLDASFGHDYTYTFNILAANGFAPEVSYIDSPRYETFDSPEEAYESFSDIVCASTAGQLTEDELAAALAQLETWVHANLVANEDAGDVDDHGVEQKALKLAEPRRVTWAFIAWDTRKR